MGTSYEGIYFFGVITNNYEEKKFFLDHDSFDDWAEEILGFKRENYADYTERKAAFHKRQIERWGCVFSDSGWLGVIDYHTDILFPEGAKEVSYWGGDVVPSWSEETLSFWRECFEKLSKDIPGLDKPELYYGCQVG